MPNLRLQPPAITQLTHAEVFGKKATCILPNFEYCLVFLRTVSSITLSLSVACIHGNQVGDVQTACLIAGQVMSFAIRIKTVQGWFQG